MPGIECFHEVGWREVGEGPTEPGWEENKSCPQVGEVRWVLNFCEVQYPDETSVWLIYQSAMALKNGLQCLEDMESVVLVEGRILRQTKMPPKRGWENTPYWAEIECQRIIKLDEVVNVFPEMQPLHIPHWKAEVQVFSLGKFKYHWVLRQEATEWLVTTNTQPERLILKADYCNYSIRPLEICNCVFTLDEWPYEVWKKRRRRK